MEILNKITVTSKDPNQITSCLKDYGIAIIPSFVESTARQSLLKEFEHILGNEEKEAISKFPYSNGRGAKVTRDLLNSVELPTTQKVFSDPLMREITDQFWGKASNLNYEIFVVNDVVGTKHHANDLHFDVVPTFKFFIYLTDTTAENGAFSCVPGSHKMAAEIREKLGDKISYKNRELSRDLPVTEEDVISIEGKAGTLIIFTTETFHRAGTVSKGERKVMRGHCRKPQDIKVNKKSNSITIILRKIKSLIKA